MVYLVDDDNDDLELAQEALFQHSYKGPVLQLNNGRKLIDHLSNVNIPTPPQVIVLDLNMPLLDGFETLKRVRKHPVYNSTPVIVLTASANREDEIRSYELGCNYFLTKPVRMSDYDVLTQQVKKYIVAAS